MTGTADSRPKWLQAMSIAQDRVHVDGTEYTYTIVAMPPEITLIYIIGGRAQEGTLFISENVPALWREFILRYEIRQSLSQYPERIKYLLCLAQEIEEVRMRLEHSDYSRYVQNRLQFFASLSMFYKQDPKQLAARKEGFLEGIRAAMVHLEFAIYRYVI